MTSLLHYTLQPALMVFALALWAWQPSSPLTLLVGLGVVQVVLGLLEARFPRRPDWTTKGKERATNIAVFILLLPVAGVAEELYEQSAAGPLTALRPAGIEALWPHALPGWMQVVLIFFLSELIWYWLHRAEHRWSAFWRVSGHGAHHSFKKLGALNAGLNHPFELVVIAVPAATIGLVFGVADYAMGATLLLLTVAAIAHSNLDLNTKVIGWLFTTNRFHIHHHSVVLAESNTNYGCAAIIWDRVFGTFADGETVETGTGPTEPSLWAKAAMPFVEPEDTSTAPTSRN